MTFKKLSIVLFLVVIASVNADLDSYLKDTNIRIEQGPSQLLDDNLIITVDAKTLVLDLTSLKNPMADISTIRITDMPSIVFANNEEILSIKQISSGITTVYLGRPPLHRIQSSEALVYIVDDGRLTAIAKNAKVEIDNKITIKTDPFEVNVKSFLASDREIDIISTKIISLFYKLKNLVIRSYDFNYADNNKGFELKEKYEQDYTEINDYTDVLPVNCDKFGFVFMPGFGYDFITETNTFTKGNGWALGIAHASNNNYNTDEMIQFINSAKRAGLTPVVKILGNDWQDQAMSKEKVVELINQLDVEYIQIWDKPNIIFNDNKAFQNPSDYADYVVDISNMVNVKIISGSLALGKAGKTGDNTRIDANDYLDGLLKHEKFWQAIDYWGSTIYNEELGRDYCIDSYIYNQEVCLNNRGYRWELEKIPNKEVILTEIGYPGQDSLRNSDLLKMIGSDTNVKAGLIFLANGWDIWRSSTWLDIENQKLLDFGVDVSNKICS